MLLTWGSGQWAGMERNGKESSCVSMQSFWHHGILFFCDVRELLAESTWAGVCIEDSPSKPPSPILK